MFKKLMIAGALTLASLSAQAELVEYDWVAQGDGDVTLDTGTGKLWLDLDVTKGMSIDAAANAIANNADYAGWRLPTLEEIQTLASNTFTVVKSSPDGEHLGVGVDASEIESHAVMGRPTPDITYGIYEVGGHSKLFGSGKHGLYFNYTRAYGTHMGSNYDGVYLVSDSISISRDANMIQQEYGIGVEDVSAPLGLSMAGLLLGAAGWRRRSV